MHELVQFWEQKSNMRNLICLFKFVELDLMEVLKWETILKWELNELFIYIVDWNDCFLVRTILEYRIYSKIMDGRCSIVWNSKEYIYTAWKNFHFICLKRFFMRFSLKNTIVCFKSLKFEKIFINSNRAEGKAQKEDMFSMCLN